MAMRNARFAPLAPGRPAAKASHVRGAAGLIDEDELCRIEIGLVREPSFARGGYVRALLLAGQNVFF